MPLARRSSYCAHDLCLISDLSFGDRTRRSDGDGVKETQTTTSLGMRNMTQLLIRYVKPGGDRR